MLLSRSAFVGIKDVTHLAAGGETPMLKSHLKALERFMAHKGLGEPSRDKLEATYARCKAKAGRLFGVTADDLALLSSASEGINLLVYALDWQPGDNVVVADVEFPSDVLPWTRLEKQGVEVRVVSHRNWHIHLEDIAAAMDARTRLVAASHVSYFTGQRHALRALSELVHGRDALLVVDATHAAGVVPVEARYADILVSSCYKWLLGVHGVAVFYWNRERLPDLQPPFLGWHTGVTIPDWQAPTQMTLRPNADRFVPGNPSFISIYVLDNALSHILDIGVERIQAHVLELSGRVWAGVHALGYELMTPRDPERRAGNVCFLTPHIEAMTTALAERGVLIWGGYGGVGRIRVSTHLYNDAADVEQFLTALQTLE